MEDSVASELARAAADIEDCETASEVYWSVLDGADRLLEYDIGTVCVLERGTIRPRAVRATDLYPREFLSEGEGLVGETIDRGEQIQFSDVAADPERRSIDGMRSAITSPIDSHAAVQLLSSSTEIPPDAGGLLALLAKFAESGLQRIRTESKLDREHEELAALFENLPEPSIRYRLCDGVPTIESVNPAFVSTFIGEPAVLKDRTVMDVLSVDDSDDVPEWTVPRTGVRYEDEVERETTSGSRRFKLRIIPKIASGTTSGDAGYFIYEDVEEERRREEALQNQNERLEEFTSAVSHDLRNPLTVAKGNLGIIQQSGEIERLEKVERYLDRMNQLIDDVLSFAREGKSVIQAEPIRLEIVAERAWETVATGDARLTIVDESILEADQHRMSRLLENLYRNAIDHGPSDVHIQVGATADGAGFFVADDGPGMTPDVKAQALEPGFSTAENGTGYGLALVEQIADAHGWTIRLADSDRGGLRVVIGSTIDEPE